VPKELGTRVNTSALKAPDPKVQSVQFFPNPKLKKPDTNTPVASLLAKSLNDTAGILNARNAIGLFANKLVPTVLPLP
jgi:hypothetical protein